MGFDLGKGTREREVTREGKIGQAKNEGSTTWKRGKSSSLCYI